MCPLTYTDSSRDHYVIHTHQLLLLLLLVITAHFRCMAHCGHLLLLLLLGNASFAGHKLHCLVSPRTVSFISDNVRLLLDIIWLYLLTYSLNEDRLISLCYRCFNHLTTITRLTSFGHCPTADCSCHYCCCCCFCEHRFWPLEVASI